MKPAYVCRECGEACETTTGGAKPFRVSKCHQASVMPRLAERSEG